MYKEELRNSLHTIKLTMKEYWIYMQQLLFDPNFTLTQNYYAYN